MMVATATLATAESLSPETKPRRPTSLAIASNRSRALSVAVLGGGSGNNNSSQSSNNSNPVLMAAAAELSSSAAAGLVVKNNNNKNGSATSSNNNNASVKISAFSAYSSSTTSSSGVSSSSSSAFSQYGSCRASKSNSSSSNNNNNIYCGSGNGSQRQTKENNQQLPGANGSDGTCNSNNSNGRPSLIMTSSQQQHKPVTIVSRHESIRAPSAQHQFKSLAMTTTTSTTANGSVETVEAATCLTSVLQNGTNNAKTGGVAINDESLEYASVTYRYLKGMEANSKGAGSSKNKVPSYARSLMCLTETQKAGGAPDESIVSVPCPQPSSECPTPAAIRTSLRRRHSDINLSSIANFLRTRFSRHDDTIQPTGNEPDDILLLKRPLSRQEQFSNNNNNNTNSENGNNKNKKSNGVAATPSSSTSTSTTAGNSNVMTPMTTNGGSKVTGNGTCPHVCSNGGNAAGWRRPCFRCKNHLIEAILESDATEV